MQFTYLAYWSRTVLGDLSQERGRRLYVVTQFSERGKGLGDYGRFGRSEHGSHNAESLISRHRRSATRDVEHDDLLHPLISRVHYVIRILYI